MAESSLPPPPPPPPRPIPTRPPAAGSNWKDPERPPVVPFGPGARWGLGDAFASYGIFILTSVALVGIAFIVNPDGTGLNSPWLPILIAVPQIAQGLHVTWVARARGHGVDRDYGMKFAGIDWLIGPMMLVLGFIGVAGLVAALDALGLETPTATVADLVEDAADEPDDVGATGDGSTADDGATDDGDDTSGLTIWIVMVAVFAATAVPLIEELVYRGLWWSALLKRGMSEWWVLLITSVAFAAAHLEPGRFPVLFVLGLALGMGRFLTGRLGAPIITHALINGIGMIALLATI